MTKAWTNYISRIRKKTFTSASLKASRLILLTRALMPMPEWPFHLYENEVIRQKKLVFLHEVAMFDSAE